MYNEQYELVHDVVVQCVVCMNTNYTHERAIFIMEVYTNIIIKYYEKTICKNISFFQNILYCSHKHCLFLLFYLIITHSRVELFCTRTTWVHIIDTAHMNNWKHYDMYHDKVDSKKVKTFYWSTIENSIKNLIMSSSCYLANLSAHPLWSFDIHPSYSFTNKFCKNRILWYNK